MDKYKLYVFIISRNYEAQTHYLQELNSEECVFLPIFLEVDPFQIRSSSFIELEQKLELCSLPINDLVVKDKRDQPRVIGNIVDKSLDILWKKRGLISLLNHLEPLAKEIDKSGEIATVGIGYRHVQKLIELLDIGSKVDVRAVGISGMGGVGKTALAGDVFNKISHLFDSAYFISSPNTSQFDCPNQYMLKEAFLRIAFPEQFEPEYSESLRLYRMLVVFDDVGYCKHFCKGWIRGLFGGGSRIIVTGRDEGLLRELGVDEIHKVELLNQNEALRLFCKIVFRSDEPMRGYEELTVDALRYVDGLPLAIKSVGSSLVGLSVSKWKSVLTKLQTVPDFSVLLELKKSFDGLTYEQKNAFLDIACCFAGQKIDYIKGILRTRYFDYIVETIVRSLTDKSLIIISNQRIKIHSLLQQLAKVIVQRESSQPGRRSRIWNYEDFRHVMETNTGTNRVEVIVLSNEEPPQGTTLNIEGLSKMRRLRILVFHNVKFSGSLYDLSSELRYISWQKYPFNYLPSNFIPKDLVELIMPNSNMTQLWRDQEFRIPLLTSLNLCGSKDLKKISDFRLLPCLEKLDLEGCTSLRQLHPSIASLQKLELLNLRNCTDLDSIPNELFGKSSLEFLNLAGCSKFAQCFSRE